jgi:large exoprotein involved in heme utilization and adhesion
LLAVTQGNGDAGDITIKTGSLVIREGAQVSASTFSESEGRGGNITVTADSIDLVGRVDRVSSGLFAITQASGDAGDLKIETGSLTARDGAVISTRTFGSGDGGDIKINASNVDLSGISTNGFSSGLLALTSQTGRGGNITVKTNAFRVADRAVVDVRTITTGNSGDIIINADTFQAINGGQVVASAYENSRGVAGNIEVTATEGITISGKPPNPVRRFILVDPPETNVENNDPTNSGLFVLSRGTGNAGSLDVTADSISLDDGGNLLA